MNILNGGHFGDFITMLYVVKYYHDIGNDIHLYLTPKYFGEYNYNDVYDDLKSLVDIQPYIKTFNKHNGEHIDLDLTDFRNHPNFDIMSIIDIMCEKYNVKKYIDKWLFVENDNKFKNKILIHRSLRRLNSDFPWEKIINKYKNDIIFISKNKKEYENFKHKEDITYYNNENILDLTKSINSCDIFIGNQSLPCTIAFALNKNRVVEIKNDVIRSVLDVKNYDNCDYYYSEELKNIGNVLYLSDNNLTFNVYLKDEVIHFTVNGYVNNCEINIYNIDNQLVYIESKNLEKDTIYWILPDNKSYLIKFIITFKFKDENHLNIEKKIMVTDCNSTMGDVIRTKGYLDNIKPYYDKIVIRFRMYLFYRFRNNPIDNMVFARHIIELLFNESPYVIDYVFNDEGNIHYSVPTTYVDLRKYFTNENFNLIVDDNVISDYIVVLTKFRGFSVNEYINNVKDKYIKILQKISNKYKIIILGEKELDNNIETIDNFNIYKCIYRDIVDNINDNVIDLTSDQMLLSKPDIELFLRDCNIINGAILTLVIGDGGQRWMVSSVGKVINLIDKVSNVDYPDIENIRNENHILCDNIDSFEIEILKKIKV